MKALIGWINDRIGLPSAVDRQLGRTLQGGASWRYVLPGTLLFAFLVEVITGLVLWAFYCPSSQSAWESVYWFQEVVQAGWLVRGIHFFAGHAMVVLAGLYVAQLVLTGMYRAPREFVFWAAVSMLLILLGLLITGDLLRWDQEGYWATRVRVGFLTLLPKIGADAFKLVLGGSDIGHLTLTRFVVLHVGILSVVFASLLCWHNRMLARVGLAGHAEQVSNGNPSSSYWPGQALRNLLAALALSAVVGLLCTQNYWRGPHPGQRPGEYLGAALGAPADPVDSFAAARPEWAFRPLYQLTALFKSSSIGNTGLSWQVVPIFGITSGLVLLVFLMPFVGKLSVGHVFNVALLVAIVAGAAGLGAASLWNDRRDAKFQAAATLGEETALRARELVRPPLETPALVGTQSAAPAATASLASVPQGIPVDGALALMHNDPKIAGRALFQQHCASCHNHSDAQGRGIVSEKPSAPNLYGFGSRPWLAGLLDPQKIVGPDYYGNTALRKGEMPGFVKDTLGKLEGDEKKQLEMAVAALSAETGLSSQKELDAKESARIGDGKKLIVGDYGCTDCHRYGGKGQLGNGPDLSGWGSREWLVGIIGNPAHARFYGKKNDRMPAYAEFPAEPDKNVLSAAAIGILADWLRGDWYEPAESRQ
jgi:ubiquinol-cytochrome c reductase cytochrome b subunit